MFERIYSQNVPKSKHTQVETITRVTIKVKYNTNLLQTNWYHTSLIKFYTVTSTICRLFELITVTVLPLAGMFILSVFSSEIVKKEQ